MTTRQQAILRELNLYPLWRLRSVGVPAPQVSGADISTGDSQQAEMGIAALHPSYANWDELKVAVKNCTLCKLRAGCTQTVFGVGDEKADWLFVGEGPGADEDMNGEPFVGQAGKLGDK